MASVLKQQFLPPDPTSGRKIEVIGAGYSQTATVSFSLALQILLKGPVCHSGTACMLGEQGSHPPNFPQHILTNQTSGFIKKWTTIINADATTDKAMIKDTLSTLLTGYVAVADCPATLFSGELAEVYPNAIVICTTRDPEKWYVSFENVAKTTHVMKVLNLIFLPFNDVKLSSPLISTFGDAIRARMETLETMKSAGVATTLDRTPVRDAEWMDIVCTRGYNAVISR
jgi:hypothetical protein